MTMSISHAHPTNHQKTGPIMNWGVILVRTEVFKFLANWLPPTTTLTGSNIPHPITESTRNMFRHMRVKRMKIAASRPTVSIKAFSFSFITTLNHAQGVLAIGGGACFESACFNRGAYTAALNGRRKQKRRAITNVIPIEVPSDARKAVSWICLLSVSDQFPHLSILADVCHIPAPRDVYE